MLFTSFRSDAAALSIASLLSSLLSSPLQSKAMLSSGPLCSLKPSQSIHHAASLCRFGPLSSHGFVQSYAFLFT